MYFDPSLITGGRRTRTTCSIVTQKAETWWWGGPWWSVLFLVNSATRLTSTQCRKPQRSLGLLIQAPVRASVQNYTTKKRSKRTSTTSGDLISSQCPKPTAIVLLYVRFTHEEKVIKKKVLTSNKWHSSSCFAATKTNQERKQDLELEHSERKGAVTSQLKTSQNMQWQSKQKENTSASILSFLS